MAIGAPKLGSIRDEAAVRSATQQIGAYVATARAAAIRRGLRANFRTRADTMWVEIQQPGAAEIVAPPIPLSASFNVTLTSSTDSIAFDGRGFALGLDGRQTYVVSRAEVTDSVCVTRLGMVTARCDL